MKAEIGMIVKAAAGKEMDRLFIIMEIEKGYALIADGKKRKLEKPKKKSLKHLKFTNNIIEINGITDKKLRNVLSSYSHTATDMGRY